MQRIKKMVKELSNGLMVNNIVVGGRMANSMGKGS